MAIMLKPEEIKNVTFEQSVFSGYKKEDVDAFLDKLYGEYSRLYKENGELVGKLKVCVSKIEEYREDEKFLKSAIVNAQKLNENALVEMETKRKETEANARAQAEEILTQAKAQADQMLSEADAKVAEFREKTTREFADKQQEIVRSYEAEKKEYEAKIAEKKAEFAALAGEVEAYRLRAMQVLEQQADLLRQLPEKPQNVEIAPVKTEEEISVAPAQETVETKEPGVSEEPAEEVPNVNVEDNPIAVTEEEPVVEAEEELIADAKEESVSDADEEQISIDDVLSAQSSPVEPVAPEFSTEDDDEDEDDEDDGFQLFGGSSLIFPQDISDDEDDEQDGDKDKNPRYRKKLKFGVNFDVKKDK